MIIAIQIVIKYYKQSHAQNCHFIIVHLNTITESTTKKCKFATASDIQTWACTQHMQQYIQKPILAVSYNQSNNVAAIND